MHPIIWNVHFRLMLTVLGMIITHLRTWKDMVVNRYRITEPKYKPAKFEVVRAHVHGPPAMPLGRLDIIGKDGGGCGDDVHMSAMQCVGWPESLAWTVATYVIEAGWRVARLRQMVLRV